MFEQFDKSVGRRSKNLAVYEAKHTSDDAKTDPTEGVLPAEHIEALPGPVSQLFGDPNWFDKKATAAEREILKKHRGRKGNSIIALKIRVRIWLRELAARRLVWCWNQADEESMALWQIYGDKGIAIVSSPDRVIQALGVKDFQGSFGMIHYVDRDQLTEKFEDPECFSRPYYFKQKSFGFENEVRFIIAIEPTLGREAGHVIAVDFAKLVDRIVISPHMPKTEAEHVGRRIHGLLPPGAHIPIDISDGTVRRLGEVTLQDFPHALADEIFGNPYEIDSDLPTALSNA
jgi:hypothetical protein